MRLSNEILDNKDSQPEALVTSTAQCLRERIGTMAGVLGILERDPAEALAALREKGMQARGLEPAEIDRLVDERNAAREAKDWARADAVRDQLNALGVELMDGPGGTTWKLGS